MMIPTVIGLRSALALVRPLPLGPFANPGSAAAKTRWSNNGRPWAVVFTENDLGQTWSARCFSFTDYSYLGLFVPWTIRTMGGLFVRWTIRTMDFSYHGLFVLWTVRGTGRSAPESIRPGSIRPMSAPSAVVPPQVHGRSAPGPGSFRPNCSVVFKRGLVGVKA